METKSLLYGLIGFFLGGLIVSIAVTLERPPEMNRAQQAGTQAIVSPR